MFLPVPVIAHYRGMIGPVHGASFSYDLRYLDIMQGNRLLPSILAHDALVPYISTCKMFLILRCGLFIDTVCCVFTYTVMCVILSI